MKDPVVPLSVCDSVITGASLVPVRLTVMVWVAFPPLPSSTVAVNVSVYLSPSPSASLIRVYL